MTRERRIAIAMWEFIVEHFNENDVAFLKEVFIGSYPEINWHNNCWFCEYCRRDFRPHPGRDGIEPACENCQLCPLYRYEIAHGNHTTVEDACGCCSSDWLKEPLFTKAQLRHSKKAAETILMLMQGAKLYD